MSITTDQIIALVLALGGGAAIREIIAGLYRWATGRQGRERAALRQAMSELDHEASYRRRVTEHAHEVRRICIEHGLADELPEFPSRTASAAKEEG